MPDSIQPEDEAAVSADQPNTSDPAPSENEAIRSAYMSNITLVDFENRVNDRFIHHLCEKMARIVIGLLLYLATIKIAAIVIVRTIGSDDSPYESMCPFSFKGDDKSFKFRLYIYICKYTPEAWPQWNYIALFIMLLLSYFPIILDLCVLNYTRRCTRVCWRFALSVLLSVGLLLVTLIGATVKLLLSEPYLIIIFLAEMIVMPLLARFINKIDEKVAILQENNQPHPELKSSITWTGGLIFGIVHLVSLALIVISQLPSFPSQNELKKMALVRMFVFNLVIARVLWLFTAWVGCALYERAQLQEWKWFLHFMKILFFFHWVLLIITGLALLLIYLLQVAILIVNSHIIYIYIKYLLAIHKKWKLSDAEGNQPPQSILNLNI